MIIVCDSPYKSLRDMTAHVPPSSAYKKNAATRFHDQTISSLTSVRTLYSIYQHGDKMKDSSLAINNNNNIKTTNSSSGNSNKLCVTVVGSSAVGKTGSLSCII